SFTVTAAGQPSLSVNPGSLTFPFTAQAADRSRPLSISNTGGGQISFTASPATASGGNWLRVSPATASIGPFGSSAINISASPAALGPGTYSGTVTVTSVNPAQSIVVPVTMTITSAIHTILADRKSTRLNSSHRTISYAVFCLKK